MTILKKMYEGMANSPITQLTQPINSIDTTIYVIDESVFPDAPNIAVIGMKENAETIIYGSKTAGMLSGIQRGIEGTAKSWDIDEPVSRNWTNKDYQMLIDNINILNAEKIELNDIPDVQDATDTIKGILTLGSIDGAARYGHKEDINLDNVDNTSDLDKPISRETKEAFDDLSDQISSCLMDWNFNTTYKLNELVKVDNIFYYSLKSNNKNHTVTNTTWWLQYGETPKYEANMIQSFCIPHSTGKTRLKVEMPLDAEGVMIRYKNTTWAAGDNHETGTLVADITNDTNYKGMNQWYIHDTGLPDGTILEYKYFPRKGNAYNEKIGVNETKCKTGGLLAEYTFDSVSGTTVNDTSGNNKNATASNIIYEQGIIGNRTKIATTLTQLAIPNVAALYMTGFFQLDNSTPANGRMIYSQSSGPGLNINTNGQLYNYSGGYAYSPVYAPTPLVGFFVGVTTTGIPKIRFNASGGLQNTATYAVSGNITLLVGSMVGNPNAMACDQLRLWSRQLEDYEEINLYNGGTGC